MLETLVIPTPVPGSAAATAIVAAVPATPTPPLPAAPPSSSGTAPSTAGAQAPSVPLVNAPSALQRQVLTQADEKAFESDLLSKIEDDKKRENAARAWDHAVALAWPAIVLIALLLYRRTIETVALTRRLNVAFPGGSIGIDQLGTTPAASERTDAENNVKTIRPDRTAAAAPPAAAPAPDRTVADKLDDYCRRAAARVLASQLRLLRLARTDAVGEPYARAIHAAAVSRGLSLTFAQWTDYLTRYGFIERRKSNVLGPATYSLTTLGAHFIEWCETNGITEAALVAEGRGA